MVKILKYESMHPVVYNCIRHGLYRYIFEDTFHVLSQLLTFLKQTIAIDVILKFKPTIKDKKLNFVNLRSNEKWFKLITYLN